MIRKWIRRKSQDEYQRFSTPPKHTPTPEEIEKETERIRSSWGKSQYCRALGKVGTDEPYTLPEVEDPYLPRQGRVNRGGFREKQEDM